MNKINFKNLPDETTAVNATNLNQVQTNVENEFTSLRTTPVRKSLFNNTNNTSLTVNLSESVYNFNYIYVLGASDIYVAMIPIYSNSQSSFKRNWWMVWR